MKALSSPMSFGRVSKSIGSLMGAISEVLVCDIGVVSSGDAGYNVAVIRFKD